MRDRRWLADLTIYDHILAVWSVYFRSMIVHYLEFACERERVLGAKSLRGYSQAAAELIS